MKYKVVVKQIDFVEVSASNRDEAIETIKNIILQNNPKALLEIQIAEEQM